MSKFLDAVTEVVINNTKYITIVDGIDFLMEKQCAPSGLFQVKITRPGDNERLEVHSLAFLVDKVWTRISPALVPATFDEIISLAEKDKYFFTVLEPDGSMEKPTTLRELTKILVSRYWSRELAGLIKTGHWFYQELV